MTLLVDAFVPPEGAWAPCGDSPDAFVADPVVPRSGKHVGDDGPAGLAVFLWPYVQRTCNSCPMLEACRDYGLDPAHIDDPMVYGGLSSRQRQLKVRGSIRTSNGRTDSVRMIA